MDAEALNAAEDAEDFMSMGARIQELETSLHNERVLYQELDRQLKEAKLALRPFAAIAPVYDRFGRRTPVADEEVVHGWVQGSLHLEVQVQHFREARRVHLGRRSRYEG